MSQPNNPQYAPAPQQQQPFAPQPSIEAPTSAGKAPTFMFILAVIGVLSMVLDFAAGSIVVDKLAGKVTDLSGNAVTMSWFNPGTMYVTLVFAIVIGVLGILVSKGSNGARITGAIFAIIFTLMGFGSVVMTLLFTAAADLAAKDVGLGSIIPNWYFIGGLLLGLVQAVLSIVATVMLFGKKTAAYCKAAKA